MAVIPTSSRASCLPILKEQLCVADPDVRAMAVAALLAHCDPSIVSEIKSVTPLTPEVIAILAMHKQISAEEVRARLRDEYLEVFDASFLLVALGAVGSLEDVATIRDFLARPPIPRRSAIAAVLALHEVRAPVSSADSFRSSIFVFAKLALDWIVDIDLNEAVRLMREAMKVEAVHPS